MASLAEMLGYLVQPLGGPGIPALAKSPNNVSAGSPMAPFQLKGPPESSPAEMMAALNAIGNAQYENDLRKAKAEEARQTAALYKSAVELGGQGPTYTTDGTAAGPSTAAPAFGNLGGGGGGSSVSSGGGKGGWGPLAEPAIAAMRAAGASDAYIQAQMGHGLAEGGFVTPWQKSRGDENSFGHWQLNAKGELPAYLAWVRDKGDPKDTALQARYVMEKMEERHPGITKTADAGAAMDSIASNFERYKGHGPGQRRGYLEDARLAMSGGALQERMPIPLGPGQSVDPLGAVPNFSGRMAGNEGAAYAPLMAALNASAPDSGSPPTPGAPTPRGQPVGIGTVMVGGNPFHYDGSGSQLVPGAAPVSVVPLGSDVVPNVGAPPASTPGAPMSLVPGMTGVPQPQASGLPRLDAASLARARRMESIYPLVGKKVPIWAEEGVKMAPGGSMSLEYLGAASGAKKGGEFPYDTATIRLKADLDMRNAAIAAARKKKDDDELAGRVEGPDGVVVQRPGYAATEAANRGAIAAAEEKAKEARDKLNASLTRETKQQEQQGAAALDVPTVVETLPDGKRIKRPITRAELAARVSPQPGGGTSPFGEPFSTETESAFGKGIAGVAADRFKEGMTLAESAAGGVRSTNEARQLLDKGIISGMGGDFRLNVARALNLVGLNDAETIKNTEAYVGSRGQAVIAVAKAFGTGSGFSSTDREYVEKMTAGKIALNEESIRKLLDINERADRFAIREHNKRVKQIDPNLSQYSLIVEEPVSTAPGRSGVTSGGVKWSRD